MKRKENERSLQKKGGMILFAAILVAGIWLSWTYREDLRVPLISLGKALHTTHYRNLLRCSVAATVDGEHYLRIKLAIPCEDRKQRLHLTHCLPRFKDQLILQMSQPKMKEALKNRDFETLRYQAVNMLKTVSKKTIRNVYFEEFTYGQ